MVTTNPNLLPEEHVKCLKDDIFNMTEKINTFFINNVLVKKLIIGGIAMAMDLLLLVQLYLWCAQGKSWRYPLAVTLLYLLRLFLAVSINKRFKK